MSRRSPSASRHDHDLGDLVDGIATDVGLSDVIRVDVDGRLAVQRAYGLADRGLGVASTIDTQFAIASGTKGLTALAVMSLVKAGELGLDTTARWLLGADAGVGFGSTHHRGDRYTCTVLCNQTRGAWPVSQRLNQLLVASS